MRKPFRIVGLLASALIFSSLVFFTACDNANKEDDVAYTEYRTYVVSVRDTSDRYFDRDWADLEREYNEKKAKADAKLEQMDEKAKAEYNQLEADWQNFKARYEERRKQRESEERLNTLRTSLVATPTDLTFASVPATDIRAAYDRFIETVRANRGDYTAADWNEVNQIFNALKARRKEINDDIPKDDRARITTLEVEYETTLAVMEPFSGDTKKD
jgi:Skp family chaperone for outer membrane proteins